MLEVTGVSFGYKTDNSDKPLVLNDVSFKMSDGEFIALLGPNGSGKSTMLKLISNLIQTDNGSILLDLKPVSKYSSRELARKIAFVPQSNASVFPYTVFEIVAMGRNPHHNIMGFEGENDLAIINNCLELMELRNLAHKNINEVSGGEAQRAFIVRALAQEPKLLILDEPSSHLDIKHQIGIFEILKELNEQHRLSIILVSHDLNHALTYCKRGILLNKGKTLCDDKINNVLNPQTINAAFEIDCEMVATSSGERKSIVIKSVVSNNTLEE